MRDSFGREKPLAPYQRWFFPTHTPVSCRIVCDIGSSSSLPAVGYWRFEPAQITLSAVNSKEITQPLIVVIAGL
jgi:hypothetical protein